MEYVVAFLQLEFSSLEILNLAVQNPFSAICFRSITEFDQDISKAFVYGPYILK